jgi:glutamyl-tRNA reductase
MGYLVVGVSHRTAPLAVLEQVTVPAAATEKLLHDLSAAEEITEAAVLATCNRLEVHAEVPRFHGSIERICDAMTRASGLSIDTLTSHLYAHYDEAAVRHVFAVTGGLDSMVVGESQILGQVRAALRTAQDTGSAGPALNLLLQQALRVGKRIQTETDLGRAGRSLVSVGLDHAEQQMGRLAGRSVVVVGAGTIGSLAAREAVRRGAQSPAIVNRTRARAEALAASVDGVAASWGDLPALLATADLVVTCTGAQEHVLTAASLADALRDRQAPLAILDLAVPRDTEPAVADLHGVHVITLDGLAEAAQAPHAGVDAALAILDEEVAAFETAQRASGAGPTIAALRTMAADVVSTEMSRLRQRLGGSPPETLAEFERTLERVVDKLLHAPTVRVKQLDAPPAGTDYAAALRELFALDPRVVDALTSNPPRPTDTESR